MIEIILYFSAGFLVATLVALLAMPFFIGKAVRQATKTTLAKMPFTASEVAAKTDQLRAEHAVALRKLEIELQKQIEKTSAQNIELLAAQEKLVAASKLAKSGKIALEEMRAREYEMNGRLRQRDAQLASIEQRSRQVLRENRDMKIALQKKESEQAPLPPSSGPDLITPDSVTTEWQQHLQTERLAHQKTREKMAALEKQLATAESKVGKKTRTTPHLPKAEIPALLVDAQKNTASTAAADLSPLQDQLLAVGAQMAKITALVEGKDTAIIKILAAAPKGQTTSLGERMKKLLEIASNKPEPDQMAKEGN